MSSSAVIGLECVIAKSENFVESNVDGETILMHLEEGSFSSLQATGLRIWQMLDEPKAVRVICEQLLKEFEVDEASCKEQTIRFLQEMLDRELVTIEG